MTHADKHQQLRDLPGVDHILELIKTDDRFFELPRKVILESIRSVLEKIRQDILGETHPKIENKDIIDQSLELAGRKIKNRLFPVINATGVVLHTNLGRALLCEDALENIQAISRSYSNLELNIATGKRGIRYTAVEELICELTGAQSAIVVNNNAGAVLLALNTLAQDTEVVVSRGELVEIGGSFRIPDVMTKSGCRLKEVGTTNRTHLRDYEQAITEHTGLFLKVHASNYKIEGFTASVGLAQLSKLGKRKNIPVMEDLGSGTLIDFSAYGLPPEPMVSDSIAAGADVVTFSGDKLLGGPQSGIIVGQKQTIDRIKANPLTRALRIDKLTLGALEATLKLYRDEKRAIREIPTLRMLTMSHEQTCKKAKDLQKRILKAVDTAARVELADLESRPGGGSFPELKLPTLCVTISPRDMSVARLEKHLRLSSPPIIGRIEGDRYILDPRTIQTGQEEIITTTLEKILLKK
ncbi:MAG: L-seryl-tRNA(Sec) selenium transferase [Proteobacteria bacterium]|nr:L-seryl-tRNA(Sec) selenium transferase [Desulfobacula sp.]MBU4132259.1 L-seryl-tRNA(Sec) selenium transferase [Pseudomonadota bacterium]